jgi:hypothetical protein
MPASARVCARACEKKNPFFSSSFFSFFLPSKIDGIAAFNSANDIYLAEEKKRSAEKRESERASEREKTKDKKIQRSKKKKKGKKKGLW